MGLTLHYELSLPASTSIAQVQEILEALRQHCLDLPFKSVSDLMTLEGADCDHERHKTNDLLRYFLVRARTFVMWDIDNGKPVSKKFNDEWQHMARPSPLQVVGFVIDPGDGCEFAPVGLAIYPTTIEVPTPAGGKVTLDISQTACGWSWYGFSKTQYANDPNSGGIQNFLKCHLGLVAVFDFVKQLGITVTVKDEGKFWEQRNLEALIREVASWDALVAGFAGKLKDVADDAGMTVMSQITKRRDFEKLEARGQAMLGDGLDEQLVKLLRMTKGRGEVI